MMSTRLKFSENFQLSGTKHNKNDAIEANLKRVKTFRDFRLFNFVRSAKSKTRKPEIFIFFFIKPHDSYIFFISCLFLVFNLGFHVLLKVEVK